MPSHVEGTPAKLKRLYLVCTPTGMPIMWALANPKIGEREVLAAMLEVDADLVAAREGIVLISDKGFASRPFEKTLAGQGIELLRPSRKRERQRYGEPVLKKVRQLIESVNDTLKGQLDLEQHGARTIEGVAIRVAQRVRQSQAGQAASARTASAHEELKARHAELQRHCAAPEDRLHLYAITINALTLENAALSGRTAGSARVVPLTRREPAP
jgi:hypothetical protein